MRHAFVLGICLFAVGASVANAAPDAATDAFNRGARKAENGDLDGAIAEYTRAIALNARYADAYYSRGVALQAKRDMDRAFADYSRAITVNRRHTWAWFNRGTVRQSRNDQPGALADFAQATAIDPRFYQAWSARGAVEDLLGRPDVALADFARAMAIEPRFARAYLGRGRVKVERGDVPGALADFSKAIALNPDGEYEAYWERGNIENDRGVLGAADELDKAYDDFTRAMEIAPDYAEAYLSRGDVERGRGNFDAAIEDYTRGMAVSPDYSALYSHRGITRLKKGDLDGVEEDAKKALELNSRDPYAHLLLAVLDLNEGDVDGAIAGATRAIEVEPKLYEGWYQRAIFKGKNGMVTGTLGDLSGGISDATRAIELYPEYAPAYALRGRLRWCSRDFAGAASDFRRVLTMDPRRIYARFFLFLSQALGGDGEETARAALAKWRGPPDADSWPAKIKRLLVGEMNSLEFLMAAEEAPESERAGVLCEANFYAGILKRIHGDSAGARRNLEEAVATKQWTFDELECASAVLLWPP